MKCAYCKTDLPEVGLDGIIYAEIKGGADYPVPVCRQCLRKPAHKLKVVSYVKTTTIS